MEIVGSTFIGPGCQIIASDGSRIVLDNVYVARGVVIRAHHGALITIQNAYLGFNAVVAAAEHISIGAESKLAEMVVVRDQDHMFHSGQPLRASGHRSAPIHIGRNVWLGARATVLKGVSIGDDAVAAAGAVVRSDVPAGTVVAGVPAKVVRGAAARSGGRGRLDEVVGADPGADAAAE